MCIGLPITIRPDNTNTHIYAYVGDEQRIFKLDMFFQTLLLNLPGISKHDIPDKITPTELQENVQKFNISKFDEHYGIRFPRDDSYTDSKTKAWTGFFEFHTLKPSFAAIEDEVEEQLFGSDDERDHEIGHGLQKLVYRSIVDQFAHLASESRAKDDFQWNNVLKKNVFPFKNNAGATFDLEARTSWVFAVATDNNDDDKEYFFVSLLLHTTSKKQDDDDD
ncbi:hypothetical protein GALMADRAFT_139684 [Galerina marginata CBS 339.88]|uniref:Uncharacterized protein n=1 Tax=Galerina marginata (strain CBS 339.88) TaxID=685588 RepID=A0A067T0T8_GALM3|nr:hypothetical protein GALMADRAFT_139684 [Galerina marginata CBS 339.88]